MNTEMDARIERIFEKARRMSAKEQTIMANLMAKVEFDEDFNEDFEEEKNGSV